MKRNPPSPSQHGSLQHIRRNVLLLLGTHASQLRAGIARYAREASWILDDTYNRIGLVPDWWRGDGILALITSPKDALAQRKFSAVPLVDFSKGWIADRMPARYRAAGIDRPRVLYDNIEIGKYFADILVNDLVIIELKAAEGLVEEHELQLINYKTTNINHI